MIPASSRGHIFLAGHGYRLNDTCDVQPSNIVSVLHALSLEQLHNSRFDNTGCTDNATRSYQYRSTGTWYRSKVYMRKQQIVFVTTSKNKQLIYI